MSMRNIITEKPTMPYVKFEKLSLKTHPQFNERWVQNRIAEDPSILGLTELLSLCDALEAQLKTAESASTQLLSAAVHHLLGGT